MRAVILWLNSAVARINLPLTDFDVSQNELLSVREIARFRYSMKFYSTREISASTNVEFDVTKIKQ